jgi:hypothetical protein
MKYHMTTQAQVRAAFWIGLQRKPVAGWTHNDYSALIRSEWVEFVDMLQRDGLISERLASKVTL